jgi:serine phosphatase RsbU (regulator of sigma subunit)
MVVPYLNSLLLVIAGMPVMVALTEANRFRGRPRLVALLITYLTFTANEILFVGLGPPFYFLHTLIDAMAFGAGAYLLVSLEAENGAYSKAAFGSVYVILGILFVATFAGAQADPAQVQSLAAVVLILSAFGYGYLIITSIEEPVGMVVSVLSLWVLAHLGMYNQNVVVNRFLIIGFFAALAISIGRRVYRDHMAVVKENALLVRTREIIVEMLNGISSSEKDNNSTEQTLNRILETINETLFVEGSSIYELQTEGDESYLRFSQSTGLFWPMDANIDEVFTQQAFVKESLRKSVFALGDGFVGKVAQQGEPLRIDRESSREEMRAVGLNTRNIRNIMGVPLRVKDELLGVLVVQNYTKEAAFGYQELYLLQSLADQAASAINNVRMYAELARTNRIRQEMRIANDIQKHLLPRVIPSVDHLQVATFIKPAKEVGGDYYDFIENNDGTLGTVIGDVSGKGLPAGMMMVIAHAAFQIVAKDNRDTREIVTRFSREMYTKMNRGQFITLNYLIWDSTMHQLQYTGAGHEHLLLFRNEGKQTEKIRAGGVAVGLMNDPGDLAKQRTLDLRKGDVLVLYTDGITEARNPNDEMFSLDRLQESVSRHAHLPDAEKISNNIIAEVFEFMNGSEQYDDMTLLVLSVTS